MSATTAQLADPGILLDGSRGHQITNFPADVIQAFQYSLDRKTLGVMRTSFESDIVLLHDLEPTLQ